MRTVITLKDGIKVGRMTLVLHINQNRRFYIEYNGKRLVSNLLWCEVLRWLKVVRETM